MRSLNQKNSGPHRLPEFFVLEISLGGGLLSHQLPGSIIGDGGLNFRVRNGIGCTPASMTTKTKFSGLRLPGKANGIYPVATSA